MIDDTSNDDDDFEIGFGDDQEHDAQDPITEQMPALPIEKRPTLQDLANRSTGIGCPNCGCRHMIVVKTKGNASGDIITRRRQCRHCGKRATSTETF